MNIFSTIVTYPPLSQLTIIPPDRKNINFTVVLESPTSTDCDSWELSIWFDHASYTGSGAKGPWQALELRRVEAGPTTVHDEVSDRLHRYTFTGSLASPYVADNKTYKGRRVSFTVRYRTHPHHDWAWVFHNFSIRDGELILQPPVDPNFLSAAPVELQKGWVARKITCECPDAKLYSIESSYPIPKGEGENADYERQTLGYVTQSRRWFALIRGNQPWFVPRQGETKFDMDGQACLVSFLRSDGRHVVLLTVNGVDDVVTMFESNDDGDIVVSARNDTGQDRKFRLLAATAWDFEVANSAVMYEARKLVQQSKAYLHSTDQLPAHVTTENVDPETVLVSSEHNSINLEWLESWYDTLAYCTWNSLGQDLNADKITDALDGLRKNDIHIASLIIDDGWQWLDGTIETSQFDRGWMGFDADPKNFPGGLKALTAKIRDKNPAIRDIAVWHALFGYWGCISRDSELAKKYKTNDINVYGAQHVGDRKLAIHPDDIHQMYDDFYKFLSENGVTGVKTDNQCFLDALNDSADRRAYTNSYQSAWTQAHLRHLGGKAIGCMAMIPQIVYHSVLPCNTPRILFRNSDDFIPEDPATHPWHIFVNAHNAVLSQHLNVLPDWDMFQTSHAYSGFHAAGRCISGGPIYITDEPGKHDVDLIHQMTALEPRGTTIILRPSNVAKTINVYEKYDNRGILKVGVFDGKSDVGTGMLGLFNIADKDISFVVPITQFPGVDSLDDDRVRKWIVRSHMKGSVSGPIEPSGQFRANSLLHGKLGVRGYDVWSALPVHAFDLEKSSFELAVVGLLRKFTGACAIIESIFTPADNGQRLKCHIALKAVGVLGVWVSDARKRKVEDVMILLKGKPIPEQHVQIQTDGVEGDEAGVFVIDVAAAWVDMDLDPGYSNEVGVELFLS